MASSEGGEGSFAVGSSGAWELLGGWASSEGVGRASASSWEGSEVVEGFREVPSLGEFCGGIVE